VGYSTERAVPGGAMIHASYRRFIRALPRAAKKTRLKVHEITFNDLTRFVREWLAADLA